MKEQFHIISHTHWDREWHFTYQQFRIRLVNLIVDYLNPENVVILGER